MEITYTQHGDYLIPDIHLEEVEGEIGMYGRKRKEYLRNHKSATFNVMCLKNTLDKHLLEIDRQAFEMEDRLMKQMARQEGLTDEMKSTDLMGWVRKMNNIRNRAQEMVLNDLIYS